MGLLFALGLAYLGIPLALVLLGVAGYLYWKTRGDDLSPWHLGLATLGGLILVLSIWSWVGLSNTNFGL